MPPALAGAFALAFVALWVLTAAQDLKRRRVGLAVLLLLAAGALASRLWTRTSAQEWPWWVLTAAALLWPPGRKRQALLLAPVAVGAGALLEDPAPGLALAAAVAAWSLGWWGGADGIALLALALRGGMEGVIAGAIGAMAAGLILLAIRKRPIGRSLAAAAPGVLARVTLEGDIPEHREMPAAAVFAAVGVALEGVTLWRILFG